MNKFRFTADMFCFTLTVNAQKVLVQGKPHHQCYPFIDSLATQLGSQAADRANALLDAELAKCEIVTKCQGHWMEPVGGVCGWCTHAALLFDVSPIKENIVSELEPEMEKVFTENVKDILA